MMFMSLLALLGLLMPPQVNVFKKDMSPLQSAVETLVTSTGVQILEKPRAAYIEGFGVIITTYIAFEPPQGIFSTPKPAKEVQALVTQRRKDVQEKLKAFVKRQVLVTDSIGASDSLAVILHVLNTNPVDLPNLPVQILVVAKKDSQQDPFFREF
jgi:hypothetical protein